jgi:hypothetical protein
MEKKGKRKALRAQVKAFFTGDHHQTRTIREEKVSAQAVLLLNNFSFLLDTSQGLCYGYATQ